MTSVVVQLIGGSSLGKRPSAAPGRSAGAHLGILAESDAGAKARVPRKVLASLRGQAREVVITQRARTAAPAPGNLKHRAVLNVELHVPMVFRVIKG